MENSKAFKVKLYTFLIYLCLYILIVALPLDKLLITNYSEMIRTILKFVLAAVMFLRLKPNQITIEKFEWKGFLLSLPLFALCFTNLIFLGFADASSVSWAVSSEFINKVIVVLSTAICEELIFRTMAIETIKLKFENKLLWILISAAIFGVTHFVTYVFTNPLYATIQMGYTFYLGLLLGWGYVNGGSLYFTIPLHFLFNTLNDALFTAVYSGSWNLPFYLVNIGVGAILIAYLAIWFLIERKKISTPTKKEN